MDGPGYHLDWGDANVVEEENCEQQQQQQRKKTMAHSNDILILGGTAFIGKTIVEHLLGANFSLTLVNRGRPYWEGKQYSAGVEYVKGDRRRTSDYIHTLQQLTEKKQQQQRQQREKAMEGSSSSCWRAVVDCCAYNPTDLKAALEGLRGDFEIYIYISTDSVYEVCDSARWERKEEVDEEMAHRPTNRRRANILNRKDSYGHKKLQVEELLRKYAALHRKHVVALRLADVIGPYDDSYRLWAYFLWCGVCEKYPLLLDADATTQPINLTFAPDVAAAVLAILSSSCYTNNSSSNSSSDASTSSSSSSNNRSSSSSSGDSDGTRSSSRKQSGTSSSSDIKSNEGSSRGHHSSSRSTDSSSSSKSSGASDGAGSNNKIDRSGLQRRSFFAAESMAASHCCCEPPPWSLPQKRGAEAAAAAAAAAETAKVEGNEWEGRGEEGGGEETATITETATVAAGKTATATAASSTGGEIAAAASAAAAGLHTAAGRHEGVMAADVLRVAAEKQKAGAAAAAAEEKAVVAEDFRKFSGEKKEGYKIQRKVSRTEEEESFTAYNLACRESLTLLEGHMQEKNEKSCCRRLPPAPSCVQRSSSSGDNNSSSSNSSSSDRKSSSSSNGSSSNSNSSNSSSSNSSSSGSGKSGSGSGDDAEEESSRGVKETWSQLLWREEGGCCTYLPSVTRRIPLSMKRIEEELHLSLTPLDTAIQQTCQWLRTAPGRFPREAAAAARKLPRDVRREVWAEHMFAGRFSSSSSSSSSSLSENDDLSAEE